MAGLAGELLSCWSPPLRTDTAGDVDTRPDDADVLAGLSGAAGPGVEALLGLEFL